MQLVGVRTETEQACRAVAAEKIQVTNSEFPNVFTPNGDGLNDYFQLPGLNDDAVADGDYEVKIYDRLGSLVYENTRYTNRWEAEGLPADVYFYTLAMPRDGKLCKGWIHVVK